MQPATASCNLSLRQENKGGKVKDLSRQRFQKGSLFLRGSRVKMWYFRWRDDVIENGQIKRVLRAERLGTLDDFPTKRLAEREMQARLNHVNSRSYKPTNNIKFEEFAEKWRTTILPQHKPSTQCSVNSHLKTHLCPTLGTWSVRDITTELLQSCVGIWGTSPKTVRNVATTLRMMWGAAKAWGIVTHNPFDGLRLPRLYRKERRSFSLEEVKKILEEAKEPYRTFFALAAETGLRAGELCGLRLGDIDCDNNVVWVRQSVWRGRIQPPKTTNSVRRVAISLALSGRIRKIIEARLGCESNNSVAGNVQLLFQTRTGLPWDAGNVVSWQLRPILDRLGLAPGGLHAFRHGSSTMMDSMDVPLKVRQDRLGHSDAALTIGTYTHKISKDERTFVDQLGTILYSTVLKNDAVVSASA